ncbi:MAG: hypothetical protein OER86_03630 [Phycisphaerae bacterium]|nr:hypothetical protein [Phycisphaerae bacterium]
MWWPGHSGAAAVLILVNMMAWGSGPADLAAAEKLDDALAEQAYRVAENWIRRAEVSAATLPLPVRDLVAVHVTLRRDGPTVGQATAVAGDLAELARGGLVIPDARLVDAMALLRQAVHEALIETYTTLKRPALLAREMDRIQLDLQFAYGIKRIRVKHLAELPAAISVGLHGLAMRKDDRWSWMFPGNAVAAGSSLQGQLNRLIAGVQAPLTELRRAGTAEGIPLYRFRVLHLVRAKPDRPIAHLVRGNQLLAQVSLDDRKLRELAAALAGNLLRRQRRNGQFNGTYQPSADRYLPATASTDATAAAALALARASRGDWLGPALSPKAAEGARRAASALAQGIPDSSGSTTNAPRLTPTAMTLLAALEVPSGQLDLKPLRMRSAAALTTMQKGDGRFHDAALGSGRPVSLHSQALASAALVRLYQQTRDPATLERAGKALAVTWKLVDEGTPDAAMPWLVLAELNLARLDKASADLPRLRPICAQMWQRQVQPWTAEAATADPGPGPDTVGGFRLDLGLVSEPAWTSARLLTAQSAALASPQLVPAQHRLQWINQSGLAARFLAQLAVTEAGTYYMRNTREALGGVRVSLSNNRQPLTATATALLAVAELADALKSLTP